MWVRRGRRSLSGLLRPLRGGQLKDERRRVGVAALRALEQGVHARPEEIVADRRGDALAPSPL